MDEPEFEWDESKDAENRRKHVVTFEEAKTMFLDDFARLIAGSLDRRRTLPSSLSNGPGDIGMRPLPVYDRRVGVDSPQYLAQFLLHVGGIDCDWPES